MLKTILAKLNGHAVEPPSLAEALAQLGRDRSATQAEINALNQRRRQALLDDVSDAALDKIEREIDRATIRLEKLTVAEAPLREQLASTTAAERQRRWDSHVAAHREAAAEFLSAARATVGAHAAVIAILDQARREGFEREIVGLPATPNVGGSPLCNSDLLDSFESALHPAPRAPRKAAPPPKLPPRSTQHVVALDVWTGQPIGVAKERTHVPRLPDDASPLGAGEVRAVVLRNGFQHVDGPCHGGRKIRLRRDVALAAARGGAIEIIEDPAREAAARLSERTFRPIAELADAHLSAEGGK